MAQVIKAPNPLPLLGKFVFTAGSIEMGKAENWQVKVEQALPDSVTVLNPRRDDWDSSWVQDISNPEFYEQVTWELNGLSRANLVLMYFDPNTQSPISLLELGLMATTSKDMIVCCPPGFWRKGNVEIVCAAFWTTNDVVTSGAAV